MDERHININLTKAIITEIEESGSGDRVCVDTNSRFNKGEGMLIGSLSRGLFLVHSETIENPYVETRPFRVNAGPVSAYTLNPNGKTNYLIELRGGYEILAVNHKGRGRIMRVVRSKIERRPFLLINAEADGIKFHGFLQNAETIRLVRPNGEEISVVDLVKGDEILALVDKKQRGRHFGIDIEETIIEK